jgi:NIMA (never in mitosis gene a)-related kinase
VKSECSSKIRPKRTQLSNKVSVGKDTRGGKARSSKNLGSDQVGKAHAFSNAPAKETNMSGFVEIEVETTSKPAKASRVISNSVEKIGNANSETALVDMLSAHEDKQQQCATKHSQLQEEQPLVREVHIKGGSANEKRHKIVATSCANCTSRDGLSGYRMASENALLASKVTLPCENEFNGREDSLFSCKKTGKEDIHELNGASSDISSMSTLTLVHSDETRIEWDPQTQQRAEGLESLLEICSDLLKQERLEELAGVLRPFGEEAVSSRETAIWLTQSLMNTRKTGSAA